MSVVTVNLSGGLGNQMFQIFTTIAFAIENKMPFYFKDCQQLTVGRTRPTYWETVFKRLKPFLKQTEPIGRRQVIEEHSFQYQPICLPDGAPGQVYVLSGYFQSYKYFDQHKSAIIRILTPEPVSQSEHSQIAIHIRHDDYKELTHIYALLGIQYYLNALDNLFSANNSTASTASTVTVYCQQSDQQIAQSIINQITARYPGITIKMVDHTIPDYQQFNMIRSSSHIIMANSTFSWWAAYLSQARVYCPNKWFNDAKMETDLIYPGWTQISSSKID